MTSAKFAQQANKIVSQDAKVAPDTFDGGCSSNLQWTYLHMANNFRSGIYQITSNKISENVKVFFSAINYFLKIEQSLLFCLAIFKLQKTFLHKNIAKNCKCFFHV